jgi:hypothetical protein
MALGGLDGNNKLVPTHLKKYYFEEAVETEESNKNHGARKFYIGAQHICFARPEFCPGIPQTENI